MGLKIVKRSPTGKVHHPISWVPERDSLFLDPGPLENDWSKSRDSPVKKWSPTDHSGRGVTVVPKGTIIFYPYIINMTKTVNGSGVTFFVRPYGNK